MSEKVLYAPVPEDLHLQVRMRALTEGRPVARLVEEAVRAYLEAKETTAP